MSLEVRTYATSKDYIKVRVSIMFVPSKNKYITAYDTSARPPPSTRHRELPDPAHLLSLPTFTPSAVLSSGPDL